MVTVTPVLPGVMLTGETMSTKGTGFLGGMAGVLITNKPVKINVSSATRTERRTETARHHLFAKVWRETDAEFTMAGIP
jgi:hypothetical protein